MQTKIVSEISDKELEEQFRRIYSWRNVMLDDLREKCPQEDANDQSRA